MSQSPAHSSGDHRRGLLLAAAGMIVISPDGLLFRLVAASDLQILFWRGLIGAAALALYLQLARPGGLVAAFGRCGWPVVVSALLMTAGTTFFVLSITRTTVANTLVILATMPLFGALLGRLVLGQRVRLATWLAIGVALSGIVVIFAQALGAGDLMGNLYALGAALCLASNLVLIRARPSVSMLPALALSGVITAAIMLPFIAPFAVSLHDLGIMAIMGVVQQSLAFGMFLTAGRYLPPAETSLFALLETVLGPFWAWLGVGEIPAGSVVLGGLLVVATLAVHSAFGLRRARPLPARRDMRGIGRWVGRGLLVLIALGVVAAAGGFLWLRSALPRDEGTIRLAGLTAPVTVIRDRNGVPLIRAAAEADAYFALGFVHAQDRLWQMELYRRIPAGRLAELFGARALPVDRLMRTIGLYRRIVESMDRLPPEVRRALAAYSAGVNAWLRTRRGALPPEFLLLGIIPAPWRPADGLAWGALMTMRLSGNWRGELLRARLARRLGTGRLKVLFPAGPAGAPTTLPERRALYRRLPLDQLWAALPKRMVPSTASNEWVVSARRSATGKPVLANDPHLGFTAPGLWYLARIETPTLKLAGATVPGVPFTILGHNGTIAWGFTTTTADVEDLFVEKLDPSDPTRYLTPDGPRRFTRRTETIKVRGGKDVSLEIRETRHGPVLDGLITADPALPGRGFVLALAASYLSPDNSTATALYRLNRARDWPGFVAALRSWSAPQQNIVYADIRGNIGFYAPGRVTIRRAGDGFMPAPGWTGSHDWIGFIPFAALPNAYNPAGGIIVNANNRVVPPGYPYFISRDWSLPYRADRILEMLAARPRLTLDGAARMQADIRSLMARAMLPLLLRFPATGARGRQAQAMLRRWDGAMDRNRPEPLIFYAWMRALARALYADELGNLFPAYLRPRPRVLRAMLTSDTRWCDDGRTTARTESCGARVAAALATALAGLTKRYGTEMTAWRWGAAHRASFRNRVLERVPAIGGWADLDIATDGGDFTVNRGSTNPHDAAHPFRHVHGAGFRAIYDLSDLSRSRFMQATGQSGNPVSPHYRDLNRRWRDFDFLRLSASPEALLAAGGKRLLLIPAVETTKPKPAKE